ncbi:FAD-dependent oxidoreductase [Conexibacter stalactiti]|uniref:FAD-dependent oxidoreductase n=1 Tax=Conexibacter stalactiti TaxID=1940611 RepID=A0ABU4HK29_9ACTN|nr:FAD-dependent oxidoreductase [Conexibacter stalactiti]MDW5593047.1 FAD-dependent oxidoreductase [Conexibacter stalactiti]MEC5033688.1 FAD-dependent oxidoreductase [Conexibacter stalactiti]
MSVVSQPDSPRRVVIVGASLAGLHAARTLRQEGFDGLLTIVGGEHHLPYDRPPLTKQVLSAGWELDRIDLSREEDASLAIDWRLGTRATSLDTRARRIGLSDGSSVAYDGLVIATGATPRRLPGTPDLDGIHVLRTLEDALALRAELDDMPGRVVIVGSGFVGAEVAAACRLRNIDVTIVEALPSPFARVLGTSVGEACVAMHRDRGVDVRGHAAVMHYDGGRRVGRVVLADGEVIEADVVVVGIGVQPETGWLEGSGLDLTDGVLCDETCLAAPDIVAAGDIARWPNPRFGRTMRVEHWDNAIRQGEHAARRLLGRKEPFDPLPWFWSDQYDRKLQLAGDPISHDEVVLLEEFGDAERLVALYRRGDRLAAVAGINRSRRVLEFRRLIQEGAKWTDAISVASR